MIQVLPIPAPPDTLALVIILALGQSAYRVDSIVPTPQRFQAVDRTIWIWWSTPTGNARVLVSLTIWGEQVRIASIEPQEIPEGPEYGFDLIRFERRAATVDEIFAWRENRTYELGGDHFSARCFFNALDRQTLGGIEGQDDVRLLLEDLLRRRIRGRSTSANPKTRIQRSLREISGVFEALFEKHFKTFEEVEDAFELFARGELSLLESPEEVPDGNVSPQDKAQACQPDSTYFFLFAEFASLCARHDIGSESRTPFSAPTVWRQLLPTLLYSHRLFYDAYAKGQPFPLHSVVNGILPAHRPIRTLRNQRALAKKQFAQGNVEDTWRREICEIVQQPNQT